MSRARERAPRVCFFCGESGPMSKEHAFPRWMSQDVSVPGTDTAWNSGLARTAAGLEEIKLTSTPKPRPIINAAIREVCRSCNNGWMSQLEEAVKPTLQRLWTPSYGLGVTAIPVDDAATLATWAAKTAWVWERQGTEDVSSTPTARRQLMDRQMPPPFVQVWMGRTTGLEAFATAEAMVTVGHFEDVYPAGRYRKVLTSAMLFHGLCLVARIASGDGVPSATMPAQVWTSFWPAATSVVWPPLDVVTSGALQAAVSPTWATIPDVPFVTNG